ncbi:MAG: PadR family transcriptional regulator [Gammaproteobacteria bacterium]|nr:PadR family transcriptional regulator [Gammaproteobacteria bacterium]
MKRSNLLSVYELMALFAILRLGSDAYGVPISQEIEAQSGRRVALSGVYAALERLEHKGFVTAQLGEATPQRGGRAKTYFRLTAKGLEEADAARQTLVNLWQGAPGLKGKPA